MNGCRQVSSWLFALFFLGLCVGQAEASQPLRVMVYGDVSTLSAEAQGVTFSSELSALLSERGLPVVVLNQGRFYSSVAQASERLQVDVLRWRPNVVVLSLGVFDPRLGKAGVGEEGAAEVAAFENGIQGMLTLLNGMGIETIVMTPPWVPCSLEGTMGEETGEACNLAWVEGLRRVFQAWQASGMGAIRWLDRFAQDSIRVGEVGWRGFVEENLVADFPEAGNAFYPNESLHRRIAGDLLPEVLEIWWNKQPDTVLIDDGVAMAVASNWVTVDGLLDSEGEDSAVVSNLGVGPGNFRVELKFVVRSGGSGVTEFQVGYERFRVDAIRGELSGWGPSFGGEQVLVGPEDDRIVLDRVLQVEVVGEGRFISWKLDGGTVVVGERVLEEIGWIALVSGGNSVGIESLKIQGATRGRADLPGSDFESVHLDGVGANRSESILAVSSQALSGTLNLLQDEESGISRAIWMAEVEEGLMLEGREIQNDSGTWENLDLGSSFGDLIPPGLRVFEISAGDGNKEWIAFGGEDPVRSSHADTLDGEWSESVVLGPWDRALRVVDFAVLDDSHWELLLVEGTGEQGDGIFWVRTENRGENWSAPERIDLFPTAHFGSAHWLFDPENGQRWVLAGDVSGHYNGFLWEFIEEEARWKWAGELSGALKGVGHQAEWTSDQRLVILFLDTHPGSPTWGDWVAWVGYPESLLGEGGETYRVRLAQGEFVESELAGVQGGIQRMGGDLFRFIIGGQVQLGRGEGSVSSGVFDVKEWDRWKVRLEDETAPVLTSAQAYGDRLYLEWSEPLFLESGREIDRMDEGLEVYLPYDRRGSSSNTNNPPGLVFGTVEGFNEGKFAEAVWFNRGYLDYGPEFNPGTSDFSVSLWFNTERSGISQTLISKGNLNFDQVGWSAFIFTSQTLGNGFQVRVNAGGKSVIWTHYGGYEMGEWHHFGLAIHGATGLVEPYMDGRKDGWIRSEGGSFASRLDPFASIVSPAGLRVGSNANHSLPFYGALDDVALWQRRLSPYEMAYLAEQGQAGHSVVKGLIPANIRSAGLLLPEGFLVNDGVRVKEVQIAPSRREAMVILEGVTVYEPLTISLPRVRDAAGNVVPAGLSYDVVPYDELRRDLLFYLSGDERDINAEWESALRPDGDTSEVQFGVEAVIREGIELSGTAGHHLDFGVLPLEGYRGVSFSFWFRGETVDERQVVLSQISGEGETEAGWRFELADGGLSFWWKDEWREIHSNEFEVSAGEWHWVFLTLIFDTSDVVALVDGREWLLITTEGPAEAGEVVGTFLLGWANGLETGFRGALDDVAIWKREVTLEEANRLYQEGLLGATPLSLIPEPQAHLALERREGEVWVIFSGVLEMAEEVDGPWTEVEAASVSPWRWVFEEGWNKGFLRVRQRGSLPAGAGGE